MLIFLHYHQRQSCTRRALEWPGMASEHRVTPNSLNQSIKGFMALCVCHKKARLSRQPWFWFWFWFWFCGRVAVLACGQPPAEAVGASQLPSMSAKSGAVGVTPD